MRLLLVNGNTTEAVTEALAEVARAAAGPGTEIIAATGSFGAALIGHRAQDAIGAHSVLQAIAAREEAYDGVLIGVSTDTGLAAARALLPVPVVGMTEAALFTACMLGGRFGLVTFSAASTTPYREVVEGYGLASRLAGIRTIDLPFAQVFDRRDQMKQPVIEAARALVLEASVEAVVLVGAATVGLARQIQEQVPVPLLDGIVCGVLQLEALIRLGVPKARAGSYALPHDGRISGLDPALTRLFER